MSEMTATRIRRGGTYLVVAVLWLVAAWLLWRTSVPAGLHPPHFDAARAFGADLLRRTARYERVLPWLWVLATLLELAALALVARRPPVVGRRRIPAGLLAAAVAVAAAWVVVLPVGAVAHWWARDHGVVRQSWMGWLTGRLVGLATQGAAVLLGVALVMWLAARLGRRWWIAAAPLLGLCGLLVTFLLPYEATLGTSPAPARVVADARELARRQGVSPPPIRIESVRRRTSAENAQAVGLGPTRRILVTDTLLRDASARELRFALAHELAHVRQRHLWKGVAWFALLVLPACLLIELATRRRGGPGEPRAVPLALLVVALVQLALLPLTNAISRRYEAEADWVAVETTRDPAAARGLFAGFARTSLQQPDPPAWAHVLLDDHPTLLQRVEQAEAWRARG
jgi:STE24 endopeptidase